MIRELEVVFNKYKKLNYSLSIEDEEKMMYEYVYTTNKLEGNKLTLAQTTQLLGSSIISGKEISIRDILEQKGMYKALVRMMVAVKNKELLSVSLIKELNMFILSFLWKEESSYIDAKTKGQIEGEFKVSNNEIKIIKNNKVFDIIKPLSTPDNVAKNMANMINNVAVSNKGIIEKSIYLAQEIWLHQPFVDGNKRTGRLLINFMLLKEGFPLFGYKNLNNISYNSLLVQQYYEGKPNLVSNYIEKKLLEEMSVRLNVLNENKNANNKGFRMML